MKQKRLKKQLGKRYFFEQRLSAAVVANLLETFLESGALFENTFFGENLVDSIQPFLRIAAAALEDEALLIAHPAKLLFGNLLNTHSFISPIVIDCS